jgi:glycosyltransferase involved in cell wall biosynthesis
MRHADAFICVSQATADALLQVGGPDLAARIHVVGEGISPVFETAADPTDLNDLTNLPEPGTPFMLCAGATSPRKNLARVIAAFEEAAPHIPHHLVLVGGAGWGTDQLSQQIEQAGLEQRIHRPGYISDRQLNALYRSADAFIYASLYEGFGLPALEAMGCGCPVVASNTTSIPEVVGDAALLVEPESISSIASAIRRIGAEPTLRRELAEAGIERAKQFSWQQSAANITSIYEAIC